MLSLCYSIEAVHLASIPVPRDQNVDPPESRAVGTFRGPAVFFRRILLEKEGLLGQQDGALGGTRSSGWGGECWEGREWEGLLGQEEDWGGKIDGPGGRPAGWRLSFPSFGDALPKLFRGAECKKTIEGKEQSKSRVGERCDNSGG